VSDHGADGVIGTVVIGDPSRTHGHLSHYTVAQAATATRFDNSTDTWTVTTAAGQRLTGRLLVDTTPGDNGVVAVHGIPNHFRIPGPHTERQSHYVAGLIAVVHRSGATRIEARSRVRVHRLLPTRGLSRFYLTGAVVSDDDTYDGPAVLTYDGRDYQVRARLTGHFDPIDGQYHWQGMLYADLSGDRVTGSRVSIGIGEHTAAARISERTPWGTLSVIGAAGCPPFPLQAASLTKSD
jgi:hypothetical protein